MKPNEMPLGFVMALAQNSEALNKFTSLSENKKQEIINATHKVNSRTEMRQFVNKIPIEY